MIFVIFYTIILMFVDRDGVTSQCLHALDQWYATMIPALFPMMLLSSIAVDTGIALHIGAVCNKRIFPFLKLSDPGCYCLITGFLFGFPMGAKTTSDMLQKGRISLKEAEFLMNEAVRVSMRVIDSFPPYSFDINAMNVKIRDEVSRLMYEKTKRSPMILPILMEV